MTDDRGIMTAHNEWLFPRARRAGRDPAGVVNVVTGDAGDAPFIVIAQSVMDRPASTDRYFAVEPPTGSAARPSL